MKKKESDVVIDGVKQEQSFGKKGQPMIVFGELGDDTTKLKKEQDETEDFKTNAEKVESNQ